MKCPVCKIANLIVTKYEDVPVKTCESCEGYLVRRNRVSRIKIARTKSDEDFLQELSSPHAVDTQGSIHCPACHRRMSKQRKSIGLQKYFIDECPKCELVWFDAGELAKLQIQYEDSEQGHEMFRFRERLANMSDAERVELEERIAKLPKPRLLDREDYALALYLLLR